MGVITCKQTALFFVVGNLICECVGHAVTIIEYGSIGLWRASLGSTELPWAQHLTSNPGFSHLYIIDDVDNSADGGYNYVDGGGDDDAKLLKFGKFNCYIEMFTHKLVLIITKNASVHSSIH